MNKEEKKIIIFKNARERNNIDIEEKSTCKKVYLLKYADNKFYFEDMTKHYTTIHQDKYMVCHNIIADVLFKQLNDNEHAYTSSSGLAGHFNTSFDGCLIFLQGIPHYIADDNTLESYLEVY